MSRGGGGTRRPPRAGRQRPEHPAARRPLRRGEPSAPRRRRLPRWFRPRVSLATIYGFLVAYGFVLHLGQPSPTTGQTLLHWGVMLTGVLGLASLRR